MSRLMNHKTLFQICLALLLISTWAYAATPATDATLQILTASPAAGITGSVSRGGVRIDFESKLSGTTLRSEIRGADGRLLWRYVEDLEADEAPVIEFGGRKFAYQYPPEVMAEVSNLGTSPAGDLIRTLAFDLYAEVPAVELVAYRRGLETAYQALQRGYPEPMQRQLPPQDRGRITAAIETAVANQKEPLALTGADANDYLFSAAGGYVVKTQHRRAVFANNALTDEHEKVRQTIGKLPIQRQDDPNIGDGCFGMCGNGCSNDYSCRGFKGWAHEWVPGTLSSSTHAYCSCETPLTFFDPDTGESSCNNFVPNSHKTIVYSVSGVLVHTIRGWSSVSCIAHDWCCRNLAIPFLPCWAQPACDAVALAAGAECAAGTGWDVSWVYSAYQTSSSSTYAGTGCRNDCTCDWSTQPIEVEP